MVDPGKMSPSGKVWNRRSNIPDSPSMASYLSTDPDCSKALETASLLNLRMDRIFWCPSVHKIVGKVECSEATGREDALASDLWASK